MWRIAAETKAYAADDLSGAGAAKHPGRWNAAGEHVIYAAQTRALAALETAAHLDDAGLPQNRFLVRIEVPDDVWQARQALSWESLPAAWCAVPAGRASIEIGSAWLKSGSNALLLVPSVLIREEFAVLINAAHAHAQRIRARTIRAFEFNKLFREPGAPERLEPKSRSS